MFRLVWEPIEVAALRRKMADPADGAVVVFEGTVRNHARGKEVLYLEYEAYEPMALAKLEEIGTMVRQRFPIRDISIVHRLGRMEHSECSVAIVVVSAHRAPAFEACRFAIDTLKARVPIWKKELYADGSAWLDGG